MVAKTPSSAGAASSGALTSETPQATECQGQGGDHRCQVLHRVILLLLRDIFWNRREDGNPQSAQRNFYGPSAPTGTTLTPFSIRYPPPPGTITHSAEGSL